LNAYESGPYRCMDNTCLKTDKGQIISLIDSDAQSYLFMVFMTGCEKRMGRLVEQDLSLSLDMLLVVLTLYEVEIKLEGVTRERK
jgi:branched-subunit amino acid transport protein AzlD